MSVLQQVSLFALRQLVDSVSSSIGFGEGGQAVIDALARHFTDHSRRLEAVLVEANGRAWNGLRVALAGDSLWGRLASGDDQAFRQQVRAFLDNVPSHDAIADRIFRVRCLNELRNAKDAGVLSGRINTKELATEAGALARLRNPEAVLERERAQLQNMALTLESAYPNLAKLLQLEPEPGKSLLIVGVRYFFRRAVENDPQLFQGLAFAKMERLNEAQERGFAALDSLLAKQAERIESLLADVQETVAQTHDAVLDLQSQMRGQGEQVRQIADAVQKMLVEYRLPGRELRSGDSLSIRNDGERQLVKQLVARYRALPSQERTSAPALLNAIGKLEVVSGDFDAASKDFAEVAQLVNDDKSRAEAHHNAYRSALEAGDLSSAFHEFIKAVRLDGRRFAPFPVGKYQPQRILGAGGFGVAFLCKHKYMDAQVVVKTLTLDALGRATDEVFTEAQVLRKLEHPAIVRVTECGYVDAATRSRPYLLMDFVEGASLASHLEKHGPLKVRDLLIIARQAAQGLLAAHDKDILHRDVKPANLLVAQHVDAWQVKLIDFGLAVCTEVMQKSLQGSSRRDKSLVASSIAGTLEYAAPEQLGKRAERVGTYSDVYGWAKTCCFALFQTTQPTLRHWQSLPASLADLLGRCLEEDPGKRIQSFATILAEMDDVWQPPSRSRAVDAHRSESRRPADDAKIASDSAKRPRRRNAKRAPETKSLAVPIIIGVVALFIVGTAIGIGIYMVRSSTTPTILAKNAAPAARESTAPAPSATPITQPSAKNPEVAPPPTPRIAPAVAKMPALKSTPSKATAPQFPPTPTAIEIHPPELNKSTVCKLPDTINALAVGGSGRFLALHFAKLRQIAIFDTNEIKLVRYIPVPEDGIRFAAGMTKLVVYIPSAQMIRRYDLRTGEQEYSGKLALTENILSFCMGSASNGPLLVSGGGGGRLFDIKKFEPMIWPNVDSGRSIKDIVGGDGIYWPAANGRVFGLTGNHGAPSGVASLIFDSGKPEKHYQHWSGGYVQPGPDGKHLYTWGLGVFTNRVAAASDAVFSGTNGNGIVGQMFLPAHHGNYYMHLHVADGLPATFRGSGGDPKHGITVYMLGCQTPIAQLPDMGLVPYNRFSSLTGLGIERTVHLIPRAKLLIVVPAERDRLLLHPLDLDAALEKSGVPYLIVTSEPPTEVRRGDLLRYTITAKSKTSSISFRLEAGPPGLDVSSEGELKWQVGKDFAGERADVIVSARSADGQEAFHTFSLAITDEKAE